jgi:hypothetical protein
MVDLSRNNGQESETYDKDCCSNSDNICHYDFCRVWYSRLAWSLWNPRNIKCAFYIDLLIIPFLVEDLGVGKGNGHVKHKQ